MTTPLSLIARKGQMSGLRTALDVGTGKALFYPNTPPATPDTATSEILLGSITMAAPCGTLGDASGLATLTLTVPQITNALASGIIGWVRLTNGAGDGFMDLPVGLPVEPPAVPAPVILNALQVYTGGEIQLLACLIAA